MPINSTSQRGEIFGTLGAFVVNLNTLYPNHDVVQVGILSEDLYWTLGLVAGLSYDLPIIAAAYGGTIEMLTPILYDSTRLTATHMNRHLATLETQGADFVIPLISGSGGALMMQQYELNQYEYVIFGIDKQAELNTFWETSEESTAYETVMQTLHRTNKTTKSIAFWDAYIAEFGHEPHYIAVGAYDAIYHLSAAIEATQSLRATDIIAQWETWTVDNPRIGVSGLYAWWPNSHDLVAGYPYSYTLWTQWQPDGTKIVIPTSLYPDWLATGEYAVPPWVNTAWS